MVATESKIELPKTSADYFHSYVAHTDYTWVCNLISELPVHSSKMTCKGYILIFVDNGLSRENANSNLTLHETL